MHEHKHNQCKRKVKHRKNVMKLIIFCITVGISLMFIYYQNLRKEIDARQKWLETVLTGEKKWILENQGPEGEFYMNGSKAGDVNPYFACMAALDNDPSLDVGEYLEESSKVQAACPWYPPTDLSAFPCESAEKCASSAESLLLGFNSMLNKEKAYQSSPVSKVTKDAPPFLIIHGNCDQVVPYVQSETLYGLLEKKDCDVTLLTLDGADHADIQFFQDEVWNRIAEFFHEKLK